MKAPEPKDPKKTTVTVQIYGTDYRIRGEADPEYIRKLAAHVDAKMRDVVAASANVQPVKVAILAAINLADESFRARDELERRGADSSARFASLAARIEDALAEPARQSA